MFVSGVSQPTKRDKTPSNQRLYPSNTHRVFLGHAPLILDGLLDVLEGVVHLRLRGGAEFHGLLSHARPEVALDGRLRRRALHLEGEGRHA